MAKVWIDAAVCTGCGACVAVCPVEAISLIEGRAQVDDDRCDGCKVCIEVCPVTAIREILEVEIEDRPGQMLVSQPTAPPAQRRPAPLTQPVATVVAATAAGLALRVMRSLVQVAGRWLLSPSSADASLPRDRSQTTSGVSRSGAGLAGRGGRRSRQRRRGER